MQLHANIHKNLACLPENFLTFLIITKTNKLHYILQKKDWKFHKYECKIWKSLKTAPGLVDLHFHLLRVVINMVS